MAAAATAAAPAAPDGARYRFIDVLRFVAASSVLVQHVFERSSVPALVEVTAFSPGVFGVVLFFLVSGFVMPLSVRGLLDPRDFAVRRLFRIYPGLISALLLWAAAAWATGDPLVRTATVGDWLANLLLVHEYVGAPAFLGVTWTLILELVWYALFAVSLLLLRRDAATALAIAAPVLLMLLNVASLLADHRLPIGRMGMIYAAIVGFRAWQHFTGTLDTRRFTIDVAVFLCVMAIGNTIAFGYFHHPAISFRQSFWPWLIGPAIFFAAQSPGVAGSAFFRNRALAWLGKISLSIYLLHPVAMMIAAAIPSEALRTIAVVALTLALSALNHRFVEAPGIALGRRLARRRAGAAMPVRAG